MRLSILPFFLLISSLCLADSPGEIAGITYYDYQEATSGVNRIVVDSEGGIYVCWTNLLGWPYPPAPRYVYNNYRSAEGIWLIPGIGNPITQLNPSGYCNID
jgi:hypothetical protein